MTDDPYTVWDEQIRPMPDHQAPILIGGNSLRLHAVAARRADIAPIPLTRCANWLVPIRQLARCLGPRWLRRGEPGAFQDLGDGLLPRDGHDVAAGDAVGLAQALDDLDADPLALLAFV